jgi:hypothetical protein
MRSSHQDTPAPIQVARAVPSTEPAAPFATAPRTPSTTKMPDAMRFARRLRRATPRARSPATAPAVTQAPIIDSVSQTTRP